MIKLKYFFIISISLFLILNCNNENYTYNNINNRYKIKYPKTWIAINSGNDKLKEDEFKLRLNKESILTDYENLDVAIFNPDSNPPIFEQITVKSDPHRLEVSNLIKILNQIDSLFTLQLIQKFENVKKQNSDVVNFKEGKILVFEYSFKFEKNEYYTNYTIIPGKLKGSYYVNAVCRKENLGEFSEIFNKILNSFQKY